MRPSLFSRPSMYFALWQVVSHQDEAKARAGLGRRMADSPFGRIAFLLDLGEDALGLVVLAMGAFGHFAVALDLLLTTHVAGPRYAAALRIALSQVVGVAVIIVAEVRVVRILRT